MGLFDFLKKNNKEKEEISSYKDQTKIVIGFTDEEKPVTQYRTQTLESEEDICINIRNRIQGERDCSYKFEVKHKSQNYTTLEYRSMDLIRVKWSWEAQWIKVQIIGDLVEKYHNSPLFAAQENKNELMWKCECNGNKSIDELYPVILAAFDNIDQFTVKVDIPESDKPYIDTAARMMAEITGDKENIYLERTSGFYRVSYKGSMACTIVLKPYKKKPWRLLTNIQSNDVMRELQNKGLIESKSDFKQYFELNNPEEIRLYRTITENDFLQYKEMEKYYRNIDLSYFTKYTFED